MRLTFSRCSDVLERAFLGARWPVQQQIEQARYASYLAGWQICRARQRTHLPFRRNIEPNKAKAPQLQGVRGVWCVRRVPLWGRERLAANERARERMTDHSKFIGYLVLSILLITFVAWSKYVAISGTVFLTLLLATFALFIGWRVFTGTWPGNDATS
jgi:hypothetical protein